MSGNESRNMPFVGTAEALGLQVVYVVKRIKPNRSEPLRIETACLLTIHLEASMLSLLSDLRLRIRIKTGIAASRIMPITNMNSAVTTSLL